MENINDFPVEVLERIFSYLNFRDRKSACQVCNHWHNVLHSVQFQRRCQISLHSTFDEEPTESEIRLIRSYRNITLNYWDDLDDDDHDDNDYADEDSQRERREKEDIIPLKYLFEPCPENNIKRLLVGRSDLEALTLFCSFESTREILENQLTDMINLRELELYISLGKNTSPDQSVWVIHHNRLKSLKIDLKNAKPLKMVLPHLTKLEVLSNCRYSLHIIETYCWQLQHLKVYFDDQETMDDMMSLQFPMLTHLQVVMAGDKDTQLRYARSRNRFIDNEKEENFIKSMPKLKSIVTESDLMLYRIGTALAKYSHQLEELTLICLEIDATQLQSIEKLTKVKTITLQYSKIVSSTQTLPKLHMPHLRHLSLFHNSSDVVFDRGLAGLTLLKLTLKSERNDKVLHKICNNLFNLEHLELIFCTKWRNSGVRHLNKLKKLRILRIDGCDSNIGWTRCPTVPSLQRIMFDNCCKLKTNTLQPISRIFPGLVSIYLDRCVVTGSNEDAATIPEGKVKLDESEEGKRRCNEQLRSMFAHCIVSMNDTFLQWQCSD